MAAQKTYKCPLCNSVLNENRYLTIIGAWEEKKNMEGQLRQKLRDAEKEKKEAIQIGIERGKKKEKARADSMAKKVQSYTDHIKEQNDKIKELQLQLKSGSTSQMEGYEFEKELAKQLRSEFPSDFIEHFGKAGDLIQHVYVAGGREAGTILYECKRTSKFNKDFISQTKQALGERKANYGVLVSFASKKNTAGVFVENGIIVVNPYGVIHIAQILRSALIDMHGMKGEQGRLLARAEQLMDFIQSPDFRNTVENTIHRAQELARLLLQEFKAHKRIWNKRFGHYNGIFRNAQYLQLATSELIQNGTRRVIKKGDVKQLPAPDGLDKL